jgi:hypothetical protein
MMSEAPCNLPIYRQLKAPHPKEGGYTIYLCQEPGPIGEERTLPHAEKVLLRVTSRRIAYAQEH